MASVDDDKAFNKRLRSATAVGILSDADAMLFNQSGISILTADHGGKEDLAEWCFLQALSLMMNNSSSTSEAKGTGQADESVPLALPSTRPLPEAGISPALSPFHVTHKDYDEGLMVCSEPASLRQSSNNKQERLTVVLYNLCLTHIKREKYADAKTWLELAHQTSLLLACCSDEDLEMPCWSYQARIQLKLGYCLHKLGARERAISCYCSALACSQHEGAELYRAQANSGIAVLTVLLDTHQHALERKPLCRVLATKALLLWKRSIATYRDHFGSDAKEVATLLNNTGRVLYMVGQHGEALAAYKEALNIRRSKLPADSVDLAATICNIGQTYHQLNQHETALQFYQEFLQLAPIARGLFNRDRSIIWTCKAEIHHYQASAEANDAEHKRAQSFLAAKDAYEQALVAGYKALGLFHRDVAEALTRLASVHCEMGSYELSLVWYEQALSVQRKIGDSSSQESRNPYRPGSVLVTLLNMAQIHRKLDNFREALRTYAEILDIQTAFHGPGSSVVAQTLSTMGLLEYKSLHFTAAVDYYQKALLIQREVHGELSVEVASTLNAIGLALFSVRGDRLATVEALNCFYSSLCIRQKLLTLGNPDAGETTLSDIATCWYNIATVHLEKGETELALRSYHESLRLEKVAMGEAHPSLAMTLQHLGLVYQQQGDLSGALRCFAEALEIERVRSASTPTPAVEKLLNLVGNIHLQLGNVGDMMACYSEAWRLHRDSGSLAGDPSATVSPLMIAGYNFYGISKMHPPCASAA